MKYKGNKDVIIVFLKDEHYRVIVSNKNN